MYQIRIHGRGGQGVVTAAELIAVSAFAEGWQAQAFPSFGVERTGAPIEAFARIDKKPIRTREQVNEPDILIVQDASVMATVNVARGTNQNTVAIINTSQPKDSIKLDLPAANIHIIDATKIALEELGRNIVNTVILGAFAKATGLVSLPALEKAIEEKFAAKGQSVIDKNLKAIKRAFDTLN